MKLIDYMPSFLKEVREFKEIFETEDVELEKMESMINSILTEIIVDSAKDYGIDRYEKIYSIKNNTTDLAERKFKILSKMNNKLPFSYNWLINKLDNLIGNGNYEVTLDNKDYKLTIDVISLFNDIAIVLNKDLKEQLPANLIITVNLFQTEQCNTYYGGFVHIGDILEIRQVI